MRKIIPLLVTAALAVAGCGKAEKSYVVWRADVPGTLPHFACWKQPEDPELMTLNRCKYYPHSPAREHPFVEGHLNPDIYAIVSESALKKMGRNPKEELEYIPKQKRK